jgi:acylphosphatase
MTVGGDKKRLAVRITGRVQGVFFRASAEAEAKRLALTGWVRNRADGSVDLVAEGSKTSLDDLIAWCRHGPRRAEVEDVQVEWAPFTGEFTNFRTTR